MKQPKYFYAITKIYTEEDFFDNPELWAKSYEYAGWRTVREWARRRVRQGVDYGHTGYKIYQFENKPPYKFVKVVS